MDQITEKSSEYITSKSRMKAVNEDEFLSFEDSSVEHESYQVYLQKITKLINKMKSSSTIKNSTGDVVGYLLKDLADNFEI